MKIIFKTEFGNDQAPMTVLSFQQCFKNKNRY